MADRVYTSAQRAPWRKRFEGKDPNLIQGGSYAASNAFINSWVNAANTGVIDVLGVNAANQIMLGDALQVPLRQMQDFYIQINAQVPTAQAFYISDGYYYLTGIQESHATLGTDAGAVTAQVIIDRGTGAPGAGSISHASAMSSTFNLKATINTPQSATLAAQLVRNTVSVGQSSPVIAPYSAILLRPGDRLVFVTTGVLTAVAGVKVSCFFASPISFSTPYAYFLDLTTLLLTQNMFGPFNQTGQTITGVSFYYKTKTSSAGVTMDITQDTTTGAPGSGTSILTAAAAVDATAGVVYSPALSATASALTVTAGNRLSIKFSATPTALAGLCVVVYTTPAPSTLEVGFVQLNNTNLGTSQSFAGPFDRTYELVDLSAIWSVASTSLKVLVTSDAPTVAPGGGTVVQTDNTSSGFDTSTTANTVAIATLANRRNRILPAGYRLSANMATGTKNALAGLGVSALLLPR